MERTHVMRKHVLVVERCPCDCSCYVATSSYVQLRPYLRSYVHLLGSYVHLLGSYVHITGSYICAYQHS